MISNTTHSEICGVFVIAKDAKGIPQIFFHGSEAATANALPMPMVMPVAVEAPKPPVAAPKIETPPVNDDREALLAKAKEIAKAKNVKNKNGGTKLGLHLMKDENLAAFIAEHSGETTPVKDTPKIVLPAASLPANESKLKGGTNAPTGPLFSLPTNNGGKGGMRKKKKMDKEIVSVEGAVEAEYFTRAGYWMNVLVIGMDGDKYVVFNPEKQQPADLNDGEMVGTVWTTNDKNKIRARSK